MTLPMTRRWSRMGREEARNTFSIVSKGNNNSMSEESSFETEKTKNAINAQYDKEKNQENVSEEQERLSAYEKLSRDLSSDHRFLKEITLGKRIGFYRIRGELGSGNFSQVKLGIHALTKGKFVVFCSHTAVRQYHVMQEFVFKMRHHILKHFPPNISLWNKTRKRLTCQN